MWNIPKKIWFQRGYMCPDDRRFGFIINYRNHEDFHTIDICWWWGWVRIQFTKEKYV